MATKEAQDVDLAKREVLKVLSTHAEDVVVEHVRDKNLKCKPQNDHS